MRPDWLDALVCPITKSSVRLQGNELVCDDGHHRYRFDDGIACFLGPEERSGWDQYHEAIYSLDPLPPHPYYVRFTDGWTTMLDLGCGDGTMSASSAQKVSEIYCVNPGYTALEVLRKRGIPNMYPVNAFGQWLPFRSNFFDGVFNIFVVEHVADPQPMLAEIGRVLKPHGQLVIATDTAFFYKYLRPLSEWRKLGWRKGWRKWRPDDPTHINLMNPSYLRRQVRRASFRIVEEHIHFYKGRYSGLLAWLPHKVWENCLSGMFVFVCSPIK